LLENGGFALNLLLLTYDSNEKSEKERKHEPLLPKKRTSFKIQGNNWKSYFDYLNDKVPKPNIEYKDPIVMEIYSQLK